MSEQERQARIRPMVEMCAMFAKMHDISIGEAADMVQDMGEMLSRLQDGHGQAQETLQRAKTKGVQ